MKKLLPTIIICTLFTGGFTNDLFAQKQNRIEKLYEHIARVERDKYARVKERIDLKSAETYKHEIALADALETLLFDSSLGAVEPYLKTSMEENQQDDGARVRSICRDAGLNYETFVWKADSTIYAILAYSDSQLKDSRTLLGLLAKYKYAITPKIFNSIIVLKEKVQFADLKSQPTLGKCETYFTDFDTLYNYPAVATIYNKLLYDGACTCTTDSSILAFFNNPVLKTFYSGTKEPRPYKADVEKMYDIHLHGEIKNAHNPEEMKTAINAYLNCPYLSGCPRNFLPEVEYTNDSVDLVILIAQIDSSARLPLVKKYLQNHKYKPFRDKAYQLREQFVDSMIWSTPSCTKYHRGNKITCETLVTGDTTTNVCYKYNDHGYLLESVTTTRVKDSTLSTVVTTFKYNDLGKCFEEETVDSLSKNILCQVNCQYNIQGHISMKNTKWHNDRNRIETYNNEGQIIQIQEYANGQIYAQTDLTYDNKGRLMQEIKINLKPDIHNPITKQTSRYGYNPYGYLTAISYEKENLQNEKITGNTTIHYDEFGNQTDPRYKYEYDNTGAWIVKTDPQNPANSEKIEYIYK
ncbi:MULTISPECIES: hypothetical protein [Butyricimonas]|uniref:hypothetical protein n=1 Tax=Butyricimonas TaxID=574697 RepID=UPI0007FB3D38|nr:MULTISPECIES: hypothetical protein [Butyricimonas]